MSDKDTQHPVFDGPYVTFGGRRMLRVIGAEGDDPPKDDPDPDKADPPKDDPPKDDPDYKSEAEKWKALARKHEAQSKSNAEAARKLKELEDADKTEAQKAADKAAEAEKRATTAERSALQLEVALDKAPEGMSLAQVRKLAKRLTGGTREELEADADELFADFAPDTGGDEGDEGEKRKRPGGRPKTGATSTSDPEETDPDKLAAKVPRMY